MNGRMVKMMFIMGAQRGDGKLYVSAKMKL